LRSEWQSTVDAVLAIMQQESLLESNPLLVRSIRNRFPYLDPLNYHVDGAAEARSLR